MLYLIKMAAIRLAWSNIQVDCSNNSSASNFHSNRLMPAVVIFRGQSRDDSPEYIMGILKQIS